MFHFPRRYGRFPHAGVATHQRPKGNGRAGYCLPRSGVVRAADDPGRWRHGRCPGGGEPGRDGAAAAGPCAGRGRRRAIPFVASKQLGDSNLWMPIAPQTVWHMRQSIEYSMTANRAILDFASRYREKVLYDVYRMGRDEIQWGSEDHWTFTPHKMARVQDGLVARGVAIGDRDSRRRVDAGCRGGRPWRRRRRPGGGGQRRRSALRRAARRRSCAIRAASSCRPIRSTSGRPPGSSMRSSGRASTSTRATAPFT